MTACPCPDLVGSILAEPDRTVQISAQAIEMCATDKDDPIQLIIPKSLIYYYHYIPTVAVIVLAACATKLASLRHVSWALSASFTIEN